MHPVIGQALAAEHVKSITAAAGRARLIRHARRARPREADGPRRLALLRGE